MHQMLLVLSVLIALLADIHKQDKVLVQSVERVRLKLNFLMEDTSVKHVLLVVWLKLVTCNVLVV